MLNQFYQFAGVSLLSGFALASFLGWELGSAVAVASPPPVNASISSSSLGWGGRSSSYHSSSSSGGTRSGWGGIAFGGK